MASVTIELPTLLARAVDTRRIEVQAAHVGGAIDALLAKHPGLRSHLLDDRGRLRRNVLCAVDGEPTRLGDDDRARPLADHTTIVFVPSVAGGT